MLNLFIEKLLVKKFKKNKCLNSNHSMKNGPIKTNLKQLNLCSCSYGSRNKNDKNDKNHDVRGDLSQRHAAQRSCANNRLQVYRLPTAYNSRYAKCTMNSCARQFVPTITCNHLGDGTVSCSGPTTIPEASDPHSIGRLGQTQADFLVSALMKTSKERRLSMTSRAGAGLLMKGPGIHWFFRAGPLSFLHGFVFYA